MNQSALQARLEAAAGDRTYRHLAQLTKQHPENVRRYMQGQSPSLVFVTNFCAALGISADWLLTGQGPMKAADLRGHMLKTSGPTDLLGAMADRLEDMRTRLERLELYVQTLETRVRALSASPPTPDAVEHAPTPAFADAEPKPRTATLDGAAVGPHAAASRAIWIAGAVAQRPSSSSH